MVKVLQEYKFGSDEHQTKLEEEFCKYLEVKHAVATCSGTSSLHSAWTACGIGAGDEMITATSTHSSTVVTIMIIGAHPILVDINDDTLKKWLWKF